MKNFVRALVVLSIPAVSSIAFAADASARLIDPRHCC